MIRFFSLLTLIVLLASSCNKDKKAAKELDGKWREVRSEVRAGDVLLQTVEPLYLGGDFYFYRCDLKKQSYCDLLIQLYHPEDTTYTSFPYYFQVKDKADSLIIKEGYLDSAFLNRFKIQVLEENEFILQQTINGDTLYERVFSRVN